MFAGQVIVGGCVSTTVTVNEQLAWAPDGAVAEQVTVVTPFENGDPDSGEHETVVPSEHTPPTVGLKLTARVHCPGSVLTLMLAGQVSWGAVAETLTLLVELLLLASASAVVEVTVAVLATELPSGTEQPTVAVNVIVADELACKEVKVTVRLLPLPPHTAPTPPLTSHETKVRAAGRLSVTVT